MKKFDSDIDISRGNLHFKAFVWNMIRYWWNCALNWKELCAAKFSTRERGRERKCNYVTTTQKNISPYKNNTINDLIEDMFLVQLVGKHCVGNSFQVLFLQVSSSNFSTALRHACPKRHVFQSERFLFVLWKVNIFFNWRRTNAHTVLSICFL